MNTTVPVVENLRIREATVSLSVDMMLAGIKVRVSGTYYVNTNTYYPSGVVELGADGYSVTDVYDFDTYCENMDWDGYEAGIAIAAAVENR